MFSRSVLQATVCSGAGAATGALIVAMTTPKTGPELRDDLRNLGRRAKRRAAGLAEEAGEAWDEAKGRTSMAASDLKRGMTDAVNDLRGESDARSMPGHV